MNASRFASGPSLAFILIANQELKTNRISCHVFRRGELNRWEADHAGTLWA